MSILIFIIILLVLVLVHEAGHFWTAKKFGIRVDEFGFGFPPKLFGIKKGETEYTFNALPIGGFVKIFGENPDEDNTNGPDAGRSFVNKPAWQQAIVLFAGIFANFLLAWLLFAIGFMSGFPTSVDSSIAGAIVQNASTVIVSVVPKSPATEAGLGVGDKIVNIKNENNFSTTVDPETVKAFIVGSGGKEIDIGYTRGQDKEVKVAKIIPVKNPDTGNPSVGISMDVIGTAKLPFLRSFWEGLRLTWFTARDTAVGIYTLIMQSIRGHGSLQNVAGPVGMVSIVNDAYHFGFVYLLSFMALISINLAIINLLPFPALDGGRLFFLLIEKIKGSRMNPRVINTINTVGFGLLILLMVVITYHDIVHLF